MILPSRKGKHEIFFVFLRNNEKLMSCFLRNYLYPSRLQLSQDSLLHLWLALSYFLLPSALTRSHQHRQTETSIVNHPRRLAQEDALAWVSPWSIIFTTHPYDLCLFLSPRPLFIFPLPHTFIWGVEQCSLHVASTIHETRIAS